MPVLLISRGSYSGGQLIAGCLVRQGLICLTRENLLDVVNTNGGIANRAIASLSQASQNYAVFSALRKPYKILMRLALLEYVRQGNVAYFGYSGHLLLHPVPRHIIRARVIAPIELRIAHLMTNDNVSEDHAREQIRRVDEERSRWARFVYGKNLCDPSQFDICINLDRVTHCGACALLLHVGERPEFQPTAESLSAVENAYLSTKVLAALISNPRAADMDLSARANDGCLDLQGPYLDRQDLSVVLEIANSVPGVREVRYTEGYSPDLDLQLTQTEVSS
jgi:hypothetical protein